MIDNEIIKRVGVSARNNMEFGGCSQSTLKALQDEFGIGDLELFKSVDVFSGGVAGCGETCGALLVALMAFSLVVGREEMKDAPAHRNAMNISKELVERFKGELQREFKFKEKPVDTLCHNIEMGIYGRTFNMAEEDERQAKKDATARLGKGCNTVCAIAAEIAAIKLLELKRGGIQDV